MPCYAPCAGCAKPISIGRTSLPAGEATCQPCRRERPRPRMPRRHRCAWCATKMFKHSPKTEHCSPICAQQRRVDLDGASVVGDYKTRKLTQCRRRRLRHALTWDGITDQQILDRDGWRCHICRKKINPRWTYPDKRSKSVDHVVPISQGGDDTAANKRAAHLGCNMARGVMGGGEQLALLGWYEETPLSPTAVGDPSQGGAPPAVARRRCQPTGPARRATWPEDWDEALQRLAQHRAGAARAASR